MQKPFRDRFSAPEIFLVLTLVVLGVLICFMLPIGGGFDEETHLARIWEMSAFVFVPNEGLGREMPLPTIFREISYRRDALVRAVEPDFLSPYAGTPIDGLDFTYGRIETRSVYSPPLLLPQALVMRYLGRFPMERGIDVPALAALYGTRLAGLFSYILLAWLAVRLIPFGKWTLAVLAVAPTTILQAATIGADAISNGIGLFFIGGSLALCSRSELRWREWGLLVMLFMLLFFAKVNLVVLALVPFLLLLPSQFRSRWMYGLLFLAVAGLFLLESVWWNVIAYPAYVAAPEGSDAAGQLVHVLSQPVSFALLVVEDIFIVHGREYIQEWMAMYAFGYWPVPTATYLLYSLGLLLSLFVTAAGERPIQRRERAVLFALFALGCVLTVVSLYFSFTPVASPIIRGVQGRYFIPIVPLGLLAISGLTFFRRWRAAALPVVLTTGLALSLYAAGLVLSYHVSCGPSYYRLDLCYQPVYKNWAPEDRYSPPLSSDLALTQEISPECDGMQEVRVWVNAGEAAPTASVRFKLHDPHLDRVLADETVPARRLPAGNWHTLAFEPQWDSSGRLYLLAIEGEHPPGSEGARISYSLRPEYLSGKLFENGEPVSHDIIFQYGCLAGLQALVQAGR